MVYINYGVQRLRITGYRLHADLNIFNYTLVFCLPPKRRAVILSDPEKDLEITINLDYDKTNIISRGKAVTRISNRILSLLPPVSAFSATAIREPMRVVDDWPRFGSADLNGGDSSYLIAKETVLSKAPALQNQVVALQIRQRNKERTMKERTGVN